MARLKLPSRRLLLFVIGQFPFGISLTYSHLLNLLNLGVFFSAVKYVALIDLFTDTAAILNSEEIMGCPGGR